MVNRANQDDNYAIVVEDKGWSYRAELFFEGEGQEVLESLARMAVFAAAESDRIDVYNVKTFIRHDTDDPFYDGRRSIEARVVSRMIDSAGNYGLHSFNTKHEEVLIGQVREGVRSPASVVEEMRLLNHDRTNVFNLSNNWFDYDGRKLIYPGKRVGSYEDKQKPQLSLHRVTRQQGKDTFTPETKQAIFDQLPKDAKAYEHDVLPLKKDKHGFITNNARFHGGKFILHKTFGYIEKGSEEFVPVVTELSPQHPVRKLAIR